MTIGRALWAGLRLLDRQLLDRNGRMAGCVDDLELTSTEDGGQLYVSAILSGPGVLAHRLRRDVYGRWMRGVAALVSPGEGDPIRIPFRLVSDVGDHITVAADHDDLGAAMTERWVRDHVIAHIPGSDRAPE